jgi:hypothetical protein
MRNIECVARIDDRLSIRRGYTFVGLPIGLMMIVAGLVLSLNAPATGLGIMLIVAGIL